MKTLSTITFAYLADHREAIPVIARWYYNEWGHKVEERSADALARRLTKYLHRDKIPLMMLAIDRDTIAGAAQLKYREMDIYPDKQHWLGGVFISEAYRGKGIATLLIDKVIKKAQSLGVGLLHLQTERLDGGLYTQLGWKPIEQVKYRGSEVLVMEKHLNR